MKKIDIIKSETFLTNDLDTQCEILNETIQTFTTGRIINIETKEESGGRRFLIFVEIENQKGE